jgi:hypothetical protein
MARLTMLRPRVGTLRTGVAAAPLEVDRMSSRPWSRLRSQVLSANQLCVHCRAQGRVEAATEVDHVVPLWEGGTNALANLQGLCHDCHGAKSAAEAAKRQGRGGSDLCQSPGRVPRAYPIGQSLPHLNRETKWRE